MPAHVVAEQRSREVDEASLRAVKEALDIDEVLTLNGRLLRRHAQPSTDVGGGLCTVTKVGQSSEITSLCRGSPVPPASMEAAIKLFLGNAVSRACRSHVDR